MVCVHAVDSSVGSSTIAMKPRLFESEKDDMRSWLRAEMVSLVDPLIDKLFDKLNNRTNNNQTELGQIQFDVDRSQVIDQMAQLESSELHQPTSINENLAEALIDDHSHQSNALDANVHLIDHDYDHFHEQTPNEDIRVDGRVMDGQVAVEDNIALMDMQSDEPEVMEEFDETDNIETITIDQWQPPNDEVSNQIDPNLIDDYLDDDDDECECDDCVNGGIERIMNDDAGTWIMSEGEEFEDTLDDPPNGNEQRMDTVPPEHQPESPSDQVQTNSENHSTICYTYPLIKMFSQSGLLSNTQKRNEPNEKSSQPAKKPRTEPTQIHTKSICATKSKLICPHSNCARQFDTFSDLTRHTRTYHGNDGNTNNRRYSCKWPTCEYVDSSRCKTLVHIEQAHLKPNIPNFVPNVSNLTYSHHLNTASLAYIEVAQD